MPFANDCLDQIGVCPNRLWVLSVSGNSEALVQMQLIDPLTGELLDLTKYNIYTESSSSSCSSESSCPCTHRHCFTQPCSPYYCDCPGTQVMGPGPFCRNPNPCFNCPWPIISPPCCCRPASGCIASTGIEIVMKARYEDTCPFAQMQAVVKSAEDAVNGIIYCPFKPCDTWKAGLYVAQAVIRENSIIKRIVPFYVEVTCDLSSYCPTGPISIAEIRLAMRDSCPASNFLIDQVEYTDTEIAWALRRPVEFWNEAQPPLNVIYSPQTFPFRYHWTEACIAVLLRTAAVWYKRNDLSYSAAGVSVMDTKRWEEYNKMADDRWNEFKAWVQNKKIELNVAGGYKSLGGYRVNAYR